MWILIRLSSNFRTHWRLHHHNRLLWQRKMLPYVHFYTTHPAFNCSVIHWLQVLELILILVSFYSMTQRERHWRHKFFLTADDQAENDDTSSSSSGIGMGITSAIGIGTNYHHLHKNGDAHHQVSFKWDSRSNLFIKEKTFLFILNVFIHTGKWQWEEEKAWR